MTNKDKEIQDLKNIIAFKSDIIEADRKIINLQRENIAHLKMVADDRRVTINQMNEERWAVRKLDEDRHKHELSHVTADAISQRFMEGRIAEMDMGEDLYDEIGYNGGI